MTASFNWQPPRFEGVWHHGTASLRPLVAAAPWLTILCLLVLFSLVGGALVTDRGALFDLPETSLAQGAVTGPVAWIVPVQRDTLVFFDDARYRLGDESSAQAFVSHLTEVARADEGRAMLVLADARVSTGDLLRLGELIKASGIRKVLVAEKRKALEE